MSFPVKRPQKYPRNLPIRVNWTSAYGNCCPVCIDNPNTCLAYGRGHLMTVDGNVTNIENCIYTLMSNCQGRLESDNSVSPESCRITHTVWVIRYEAFQQKPRLKPFKILLMSECPEVLLDEDPSPVTTLRCNPTMEIIFLRFLPS